MPFAFAQKAKTTYRPRAHADIPRTLFGRVAALLAESRSYAYIADELRAECPGLKSGRVASVIKLHARDRASFIEQYKA